MLTKQQMQTALKDFLFEALKTPNSKIAPLVHTILVQDINSTETEVSIEELKVIQKNIKNDKEESENLINTLLANCAVWGIGYSDDEKALAFNLCKNACEQNYPLAHYVMARCLAWALGCERDISTSIKHYKLAAKAGIVSAQRELGLIYEKSKIKKLEKDPIKAAKLYEIADKQSAIIETTLKTKLIAGFEELYPPGFNPIAMRLSEEIRNVFKDFLAINKNNPNEHKKVVFTTINTILKVRPGAKVVHNVINKIKSIHEKLKNDKKSDFLIDTLLAYCAHIGVGFKENESKLAYTLCKEACDKGYPMAQFVMAEYLFSNENSGKADKTNKESTLEYYAMASNNGISSAQVVMGKLYLKGYSHLIKKNANRAVALLMLAAEQKNSLAYYTLAEMYENWISIKKINLLKAFKYYLLSANRGFLEAAYYVGRWYEFGNRIHGNCIQSDLCLAKEYYEKAMFKGYIPAQIAYVTMDNKIEAEKQRIKLIEKERHIAYINLMILRHADEINTYDKFLLWANLITGNDPAFCRCNMVEGWEVEINRASPNWVCDNLANIIFVLAKNNIFDRSLIEFYVKIKGEDNLIDFIKKQHDEFLKTTGQYLLFSAAYGNASNVVKYLVQVRKITPNPESYNIFDSTKPLSLSIFGEKEMEEIANQLMETEIKIYSETMGEYPKLFEFAKWRDNHDENGLLKLIIILQKGANPLLHTKIDSTPFLSYLDREVYRKAMTILAEHGGGLLKKDVRIKGSSHKHEDHFDDDIIKVDEDKIRSEIVLAARRQSNPAEITWVYSAKKFGELLTGPDEDVMLPHASLIYQHIKEIIPDSERDVVATEVREAIREQQRRGRLMFSTLKKHLAPDVVKECMSFAFIKPLADDCVQTVVPTKYKVDKQIREKQNVEMLKFRQFKQKQTILKQANLKEAAEAAANAAQPSHGTAAAGTENYSH